MSSPMPLSSSSRFNIRQQQRQESLRFLLAGDTDSDLDSDEETMLVSKRPRLDEPRQRPLVVRGNVTPSKAFSIFKKPARAAAVGRCGLPTPPPSSPPSSQTLPLATFDTDAFSPAPAPVPLALRSLPFHAASAAQDILWAARSRRGVLATRPVLSHTAFLGTFVSPPRTISQLASSTAEGFAHPLCSAYSYSSRSVNPSAQWLAVGDDEGRLTLLNTLPSQDYSAEEYTGSPQWVATDPDAPASIFELSWRFDDRVILTGSSDYAIRAWDVETQTLLAQCAGARGSPKTIAWDPTGGGNLFASAGRDGAIHLWDARTPEAKPTASIWSAHTSSKPHARRRGKPPAKGVTALSYLADGRLVSAGCENAVLKCWDPRLPQQTRVRGRAQPRAPSPVNTSADLSMLNDYSRRPHGVSNLVASPDRLFAACTDGRIYTVEAATLQPITSQPLYHPTQKQNTLYAKMALYDDKFLALGCNTGRIALWDVNRPPHNDNNDNDDDEQQEHDDEEPGFGFACTSRNGAVVLRAGHERNCEINSLSWANGPNGPTLASVGDDMTVRTWYADRVSRSSLH